MIDVISNIAIFCMDLWKIVLFYNILTKEKIRSWKMLISISIVGSLFDVVAYHAYRDIASILVSVVIFLSCFFIFQKIRVGWLILNIFIIMTFDMCFLAIIVYLLKIEISRFESISVLADTISLLILLCIKFLYRSEMNRRFDTKSIVMLCFGIFGVDLFMAFVIQFGFDAVEAKNRYIGALGLCITCIALFMTLIIGSFFRTQNKELKKDIALKEEILNQQKKYYIMLLGKEEETKKFRHDIRGHVNSIRILLEEKEYDQVNDYLNAVETGLNELQLKVQTGNSVVNALVADLMNHYPDVELEWSGMLKDKLKIRAIDLCIVFSNLLSNAFKAVKGSKNPVVHVKVKSLGSNLFIQVMNKTEEAFEIENKNMIKKKHQDGHGYGLVNVKECIDSYSGSFEISYENQNFIAEVILPNAI